MGSPLGTAITPIIRIELDRLARAERVPPSLGDSLLRLTWAAQQINALASWEMEVMRANMRVLRVEASDEQSVYVIREEAPPKPPAAMALIAGDAIHSMRASLDYLAQQLVRMSGNEPIEGPRGTQFPIHEVQRKVRISGGVSAEILRTVEKLQPYQRGDKYGEDPLFILTWLSNLDKHRLLNMVRFEAGYDIEALEIGERQVSIPRLHRAWGVIEDGKEVARIPAERMEPEEDVRAMGSYYGIVAFERYGPGSPQLPASQTLLLIHRHLHEAVFPAFFQFLADVPESWG
jgi:hypothetical protein